MTLSNTNISISKAHFTFGKIILLMLLISFASAAKAQVGYAELSGNTDKTLTFIYGTKPDGDNIFDLNTGENDPEWYSECGNIKKVVFNETFKNARPTSCFEWFAGFSNLTDIDGMKDNFNTSEVTDMRMMFSGCSGLTSLDVSNFNTKKVTKMGGMFYGCSGLTSLDISNFNTVEVTDMAGMFNGCSRLTTIYVGNNWSIGNVTDGDYMFDGCTSLVGGANTGYNEDHTDKIYARIDYIDNDNPENSTPGYLTYKGPYAIYDESTNTLTFKYGVKPNGTNIFGLNTGENEPGWSTKASTITKVVFNETFKNARPTSCYQWFAGFGNLTEIVDMEKYLNTSEVTGMNSMFSYCSKLTSLDLSNFNTGNVTDISFMFMGCSELTTLDISNFNTGNVMGMRGMFSNCSKIITLDISNFNTGNVMDMRGMFSDCRKLTTIFVGVNWNTQLTSNDNMFDGCTSLVGGAGTIYDANHIDNTYARIDYIDNDNPENSTPGYLTLKQPYAIYDTDTKTLTFMNGVKPSGDNILDLNTGENEPNWTMITTITTVEFDASFKYARPTSCYDWFSGMTQLTQIVGIKENLNTYEVTNMTRMFEGCLSVATLDLSNLNTAKVTNMKEMFARCQNLTTLDLSNLNTEKVTDMSNMFTGCSKLTSIKFGDLNTSEVTNMSGMFKECIELTSLNVSNFNTEKVTDMSEMFSTCFKLTSLNVSNFKTGNVTNMSGMFKECNKLTSLNVSNFDTEKVMDMSEMFFFCSTLTSLNVSNFKTGNVTDMKYMFYYCGGLTSLDVSRFNTIKVTDMEGMFTNCRNLTSLDVSSFDTKSATNMAEMFDGCLILTSLNLSNFDTREVTNMEQMFYGCYFLTTIYVGNNWKTEKVTASDDMFDGCSSLVGGAGTRYDEHYTDDTYARIDGGTESETPGYLSYCPYVIYDESAKTLTFSISDTKPEGAFYVNTGGNAPGWLEHNSDVTNVVIETTIMPTSCYQWFKGCSQLKTLDLRKINPANTTNMTSMFEGCSNLTAILVDDSEWTADVINENLDANNSKNMFSGCTVLIGEQGTWVYPTNTTFTYAFVIDGWGNGGYLTKNNYKIFYDLDGGVFSDGSDAKDPEYDKDFTLDIPKRDGCVFLGWAKANGTGKNEYNDYVPVYPDEYSTKVTVAKNSGNYQFKAIWKAPYAEITDDGKTLTFKYGKKPAGANAFYLNEGDNKPKWNTEASTITKVVFDETFKDARPTSCFEWFRGFENLEEIDNIENLNTSEVTDMASMFYSCSKLTSLNLSNFNTGNVTDMAYMFSDCIRLTTLDLSNFNTENVTNMLNMFYGCSGLTTIYVGNHWSTDKVTNEDMFEGCSSLVGGAGTLFNGSHIDNTYARIDGGSGSATPGYLTLNAYAIIHPEDFTATTGTPPSTITSATPGTPITLTYSGTKQVTNVKLIPLPTKVSIAPSDVTLTTSGTQQLTANIYPNLTQVDKTVEWESSNTNVATITADGLVTAHALGETTITATTKKNNKTATITIAIATNSVDAFNSSTLENPHLLFDADYDKLKITQEAGVIEFDGHAVTELRIQNNTAGKAITLKNGIITDAIDGEYDFSDYYKGTVILENMTVADKIWTDGHDYVINSGTYYELINIKDMGAPGTVTINGGNFFRLTYDVNNGTFYLNGGKYKVNPTTTINSSLLTIAPGKAIYDNGEDEEYRYEVR